MSAKIVELICTCPSGEECNCNGRYKPSPYRTPENLLPNAEALMALGLCPWCGYPEEHAVLDWNNPNHIIYRCEC